MAERRMFAKTIVLSDAFLDMPMSARCLYMTLGMVADDDGFVNSPRSVMRQCGASEDDMLILLSKKFVLSFDSGVIVIKHWRINNYLQKDRYTETKYIEEKNALAIDEKGAYHRDEQSMYTQGVYTQDRLGKESIGKDRLGNSKRFAPPTLEEVEEYCRDRNSSVNAKEFYDYFTAGNWTDAKGQKVKNWKQKVITWEKFEPAKKKNAMPSMDYGDTSAKQEQMRRMLEKMGGAHED